MGQVKDVETKYRLESAISKLIAFTPIYGTVFLSLNKIETDSVPTIAVGITRRVDLALYYNPEFLKGLTSDELKAVLIHESLHVLLHHIVRANHYSYKPKGFNVSADMAINCGIQNLPPKGFYPKTFGLQDNESADFYYRRLKEMADKKGKDLDEMLDGSGHGLIDDHSTWGDCEDDVVQEKIRNIAAEAIKTQEQKGWGNIPGELIAKILAANKATINWKKEVRYFINQLVLHGHKTTRSKINRKEQAIMPYRPEEFQNVYLNPGKRKNYTSRLLIGIDTSGSVGNKELEEFVDEINGMIDHVQCEYICFDTQLYGDPKPFNKKAKTLSIQGRGGTSFHPICEYIDAAGYDGLIIMTDGCAPFPNKPRARVMWCITKSGEKIEPPWGKKVVIEPKNK